jgi:serine protease Do
MTTTPQSGQRVQIADTADFGVRFGGRDAARVAMAAVDRNGSIVALEDRGQGEWHLPSFAGLGEHFEVVAYIVDDRQGGFVNHAYPADVSIGGEQYRFPEPDPQLAAVILAEIYLKDGIRRMKVSSDGYTFGIDAYARARNLSTATIPFRNKPAPPPGTQRWEGGSDGAPRPAPGEMLGSGSGVIVGPDLLITNAHVVEGGDSFKVGRTRQGLTIVAVDPAHDLALLQGEVKGVALPLRLGSPVWLGESVMASGYPLMDVLGSDLKVTTGNISGLTGSMGDVSRFQFTAPIGSGSSGGAVIDEFGNLVGITSASLAHQNFRDRGAISENVNFAIRAALVFELMAAAGVPLPQTSPSSDNNRREVVNRLRTSVVSILVAA